MSDRFKEEMTPDEFVEYIKKCPKQYLGELPEKLKNWAWKQVETETGLKRERFGAGFLPQEELDKDSDPIRLEIATKIMVRHAPSSSMNIELLADYCVEGADALINRLKR